MPILSTVASQFGLSRPIGSPKDGWLGRSAAVAKGYGQQTTAAPDRSKRKSKSPSSSGLAWFPMAVVHRVADLPRLTPRVEVRDALDDEPRRLVFSPVVVTDGERDAFRQLDPEPLNVRQSPRVQVGAVHVGDDPPSAVVHAEQTVVAVRSKQQRDARHRAGPDAYLVLFTLQDVRSGVEAESEASGAPLLGGDARLGHLEHLALVAAPPTQAGNGCRPHQGLSRAAARRSSTVSESVSESARMSSMALPLVVVERLKSTFSEAERAPARERLPSEQELPDGAPYEQTLLATIALSDGSLDALSHFSERALSDWRDVLYWHEHPQGEDEPKSRAELQARLGLPAEDDPHSA